MRKVLILLSVGLVMPVWHYPVAVSAQDYVPPASTTSTDSGSASGQSAPVSPDYVPQYPGSSPYYAPPTGTPRYGAPPSVGAGYAIPSYPATTPLQGQVQQSQSAPAALPPAQGFIPGYAQQAGTMPGGNPNFPPQYGGAMQSRPFTPTQPLQSKADKTEPSDSRPTWLPANAYTNDAMVAPYHNMDIFFWDKRSIPNKRQWIRLSTSVSKYWRGLVEEPCMVLAVPMDQAPGNFTFQSQSRNGPRGWLQKIGTTNWQGFPMYRYWFDQR